MARDNVIKIEHNSNTRSRRQTAGVIRITHNPNAQRRGKAVLQIKHDPAALWNHGENKKKGITVKVPNSCPVCHSEDAEFSTIKEDGELKWKCSICEATF